MKFSLPIALITLISMITLNGCSKKEDATESPKTASGPAPKHLEKVMSADTLGIQRAFFENNYGPAKRTFGNSFNYEIDACSVNIEYDKNNSITSVELSNISKECNFNGNKIYLNSMANQINYSELISVAADWNAKLSCYTLCGNAADPDYGAYIETPRVYGNIEFEATSNYSQSEKASDNVQGYFRKKYPNFELMGGELGPIPRDEYNKIWYENFKDVKLSSIKFGYNLRK